MKTAEYEKKIQDIITTNNISFYEICEKGYAILKEENSTDAFCTFINQLNAIRGDKADDIMGESRNRIQKNHDVYGNMWNEILMVLFKKRLPQKKFYDELWKSIYESPILDTDEAKVYALYMTCISYTIPYYQPQNVMRMSQEEFETYSKKLATDMDKVRCMVAYPFEQKTERASALLSIINQCEDDKEKTMIMARIIDYVDAMARLSGMA